MSFINNDILERKLFNTFDICQEKLIICQKNLKSDKFLEFDKKTLICDKFVIEFKFFDKISASMPALV